MRSRSTLLATVALLYAVHALLTVHQHGQDPLVSMHSMPDLSAPSELGGPDYTLPIARLLAMSGFALLILNVITSGPRGRGPKTLLVIPVLMLVLSGLLLLFGPMALGLPWYGHLMGWEPTWYWVTVLADLTVVGLAATLAWLGLSIDRQRDSLV